MLEQVIVFNRNILNSQIKMLELFLMLLKCLIMKFANGYWRNTVYNTVLYMYNTADGLIKLSVHSGTAVGLDGVQIYYFHGLSRVCK